MSILANEIEHSQQGSAQKTQAIANAALILLAIISASVSFYILSGSILLVSLVLSSMMLAIARIDFEQFRIPDSLSLTSIPFGVLASGSMVHSSAPALINIEHAIAAFVGGFVLWAVRLIYWRLRQRHGLGLGDVKLAAAAGAWTGIDALPNVLLLACLLALAGLAFAHFASNRAMTATTAIPFGTALAPAIWIVWFCGVY